jgi:hypothetical protein
MNARSLIDGDAPLPADWPRTLVIAVGNPSRGDDAAGPLLAERLSAWLSDQDHRPRRQPIRTTSPSSATSS